MASTPSDLEALARFQGSKETLDRMRPVLEALSKQEVRHFSLAIPAAVASAIRVWQSFMADAAAIVTSFKRQGFDPDAVSDLPDRVSALWQADTMLRRALDPESTMQELLDDAVVVHTKMAKTAKYLFEDDDEIWPVVADIREGSGHMDRAGDLARYAELFTTHWDRVDGKSEVTQADIDNAKEMSVRILRAYTENDESNIRSLRDLRDRAGEYLARAVDDIRDAALYHFRNDPDAADRYPTLFKYRRVNRKKEKESDAAEETELAPEALEATPDAADDTTTTA